DMNIADTIYQHVQALPPAKALEVLHFVEFLENKPDLATQSKTHSNMLTFLENLPIGQRSDAEINQGFQSIRDEWDQA
ncbi:MAG: hypothetical protein RLZ92_1214, partial [Pseudomonadota bacterium]